MVPATKENTVKARSREREHINGQMEASMWVNGSIIKSKDMEGTHGLMVDPMREPGKTITCMGKESMLGKMEEGMRVSMSMTRRAVTVSTPGLMAVNTRATGSMESSMERASTYYQMELSEWDFGKMERESDG